ncbi:MAG: dihydrodipicolinate synthase family protein [Candidatus Korarchaeota archaeon]|nr:dihydrodipicolinate synthase family protein [Candidatus Korarchaeota archaeon]NIU83735.1 hypothetical protein [Candidatus Thorarchaeota archaeon]NIW15688.1 hypothetical protein [Candidatus Thorarchaeota archaeon]NIW52052.1 hypothetical protein [Candidatus Korarchaeota archaeon]
MDPEEFKRHCKGMIVVQYCPYREDLGVNWEGLRENTEFLVDFAENGERDVILFTNGSTTECYANTVEEQKKVIKTVVETVNERIPVIAGVSQAGAIKTIKLAKYTESVGVDGIVVVSPYYHTPTKEGMYRYFKKIANAVDIGIMVYNNPDVSGAQISPDLTVRISKIDNIVALKDCSTSVADYALKALKTDPEDIRLINGLGEMEYLASAAYGYRYEGFVSFFGNFAPSLTYEMYEAVQEKDFEKAFGTLQRQLPLWDFTAKSMEKRASTSIIPECLRANYMYMSVGKAALDIVGLNGGPLRLPCDELAEEEKKELKGILEDLEVV